MADAQKKKTKRPVKTRVVEASEAKKPLAKKPKTAKSVTADSKKTNKTAKSSVTSASKTKKSTKKVKKQGYFKQSWHELKKVRWTDRKTTWQITIAVILFTLFMLLIVTLLDFGFNYLFKLVVQ